jgi:hypothetical protein
MERTSSTSTTLQSTAPDSTTELGVQVAPALVVRVDGIEIVYWGGHNGIPPWVWESV